MHLMRERADRLKEGWFALLGLLAYFGLPVLAAARSDAFGCGFECGGRANLRLSA